MAETNLTNLLSSSVDTEASKKSLFSAEQFEELAKKVEEYRAQALRGENHTVEQMKEIVTYFRMRRETAFNAAPKKKARAKATPRISKKEQMQKEAIEILKKL